MATPGPWIAGMDFPFGQSRRLVENIGWPESWAGYVGEVARLDRSAFRTVLENYKRARAPGDKHHKRKCDVLTRSQSPQTLYGTPVALMFFEGAPRLLDADIHLPYNHDGDELRVVLEAYPGVAARRMIGATSYKNDTRSKQTAAQHRARRELLARLTGEVGRQIYSITIEAPASLADDPRADDLDAFICAVQAAWGCRQWGQRFGAPADLDRLEGWICDPALCSAGPTQA